MARGNQGGEGKKGGKIKRQKGKGEEKDRA